MKKIISLVIVLLIGIGGVWYFLSPILGPSPSGKEASAEISNLKKPSPEGGGFGRGLNEEKVKIVAMGDSLTAGYDLNLDESYPKQLEKKLLENNFNVQIINVGISGETTAGLFERIEFIKKQNPEIILITIGGNDALRALPVTETEKNILKIVQSLKEVVDKEKIFLMQIQAPANLGIAYTRQFNSLYQNIVSREKINLVPFVVPEVFTNSNLMQNDGIHPNAEGYKYLIDNFIFKEVVKILQK
jgi:acyl-CoA thioesterase-1